MAAAYGAVLLVQVLGAVVVEVLEASVALGHQALSVLLASRHPVRRHRAGLVHWLVSTRILLRADLALIH